MKAFSETLRDIRDGELSAELASKVQELVSAVRDTQKGGRITLTLTLKPMKGLDALLLEDDIKLVLPEPDRDSTTVMFPTEENELSRRDPRQPKLPEMGIVRPMTAERTGDLWKRKT